MALLSQNSKMVVCNTFFQSNSYSSHDLFGAWSAPSAIGTAGLGLGGQAGAEMTDFLVVLNSRSVGAFFLASGISLMCSVSTGYRMCLWIQCTHNF